MSIIAEGRMLPIIKELIAVFSTFFLTVLAWIFFRSSDVSQAFSILNEIFSLSLFSLPMLLPKSVFALLFFFLVLEWIGRKGQYGLERIGLKWKPIFRYGMYYCLIVLILWFSGSEQEFIYFQF